MALAQVIRSIMLTSLVNLLPEPEAEGKTAMTPCLQCALDRSGVGFVVAFMELDQSEPKGFLCLRGGERFPPWFCQNLRERE